MKNTKQISKHTISWALSIMQSEPNVFMNADGTVAVRSPKGKRFLTLGTADDFVYLYSELKFRKFHIDHGDDYNGPHQVSIAAYNTLGQHVYTKSALKNKGWRF